MHKDIPQVGHEACLPGWISLSFCGLVGGILMMIGQGGGLVQHDFENLVLSIGPSQNFFYFLFFIY